MGFAVCAERLGDWVLRTMAWARYRSDETVGAIAWFCYLLFFFTFSIVFAFVVWPTMSEEMSWAGDQCFVVSFHPAFGVRSVI